MDALIRKHATPVFAYLFGVIDKYAYRRAIGNKDVAKQVWASVSSNGYILRNCKLFAYAYHVNRDAGIPVSPARFAVEKEDVNLLRKLDLSSVSKEFKAYTLFDYTNLETAIITSTELNTYIGKFISRKLIFLCRSYGLSRDEIHGDLRCAAIYALRKQYPFYQSELHAKNICKTAIKNAGQGLIEFWTRGKRNALMKENGDFQAVHVSYDVLSDVGVEPEHDNELRINLQCLASVAAKLPPQQQGWVAAAAGGYDIGFSFFLGKDNRDAVESLPYPRYLALLCDYHKVAQDTMLSTLRTSLS
jgi:hypothetical protein